MTDNKLILLLCILYGGGIIAHLTPLYELTKQITDALLLFTNGLVLWQVFQRHPSLKLIIATFLTAILTFYLEVLGVSTGYIFGEYHYGQTMKWQWLGVPFIIGLNWAVLMLASLDIVRKYLNGWWQAILAALLVVAFDWVMEPVAIRLDYWQWTNGFIPLHNYIGWFVIALVVGMFFKWAKIETDSHLLRAYFYIQLGFFIGLRLLL